jgi:polysaccharide biosynthesis PFTS motif protein
VPPDDDMYSMIRASDLTIVAPYSSPALVSASMGVPAIYFDAPGMLEDSHDGGPLLDFASGEDALISKAKIALSNSALAAK